MTNLHKLSGFTFFLLCLSSRAADDSSLLMVAGQLNYMKAVEARCEGIIPGYSREFQVAYSAAKANMFDKAGVTDEVLARASGIPELSSAPLVEKFDRQGQATKKQYCEQNLQTLKDAAVARKETSE